MAGGVAAARLIGSDDVDSVEITVGRLEVDVVEVVEEEDVDGAVATVVVVVEVVVVVVVS